ncbi:MAG: Hsp33 family molecular chaperone HslO [Betaproteobacteria bacterium]|nr:Hsp33 family molecular chaperone HslO [Betaproteobacteria bacterium]
MPIQTDYSQRFTLENLDIRGQLVQLTDSWRSLLKGRDYPAEVLAYLGEMMCVSVLVGAGLKHSGKVTLQVQGARGDGEHHAAKLVVVDCTHDLGIRGMASFDGKAAAGCYSDWVSGGTLAMTVYQAETGQMYQSIVPVSGLTVAECFEHYFDQSEQLPTHLWLASDANGAGALLLQKLPGADAKDPDGWARVEHLASTVTAADLVNLDAKRLLQQLFAEEDVRLFNAKPVHSASKRDVKKVESMLRSLGRAEVEAMLTEIGEIVVKDDMCNEEYRFDRAAIEILFQNQLGNL